MKRRLRHEEHVNHEAWVIPYADLLTLLLALFVVLYAMSSVNTVKYRALAQAISAAFNGTRLVIQPGVLTEPQPSMSVSAIQPVQLLVPRLPVAPVLSMPRSKPAVMSATVSPAPVDKTDDAPTEEQQNLGRIRDQVESALQPLIGKQLVLVRRRPDWLEIEIRTDILFPSGMATLSSSADKVIDSLGKILAPFGNPLRVEGYTDNVPIQTSTYPSNWELSAARAASVARLFAQDGVNPDRLGIVGWGQYRPVADNASADGRNRNRRVLIVVLSDKAAPSRFYTNGNAVGQADAIDHGDMREPNTLLQQSPLASVEADSGAASVPASLVAQPATAAVVHVSTSIPPAAVVTMPVASAPAGDAGDKH